MIQNLNKGNFLNFISSNKMVLVDFYADWCGPCKMIAPFIKEVSEKQDYCVVGKVDTDVEQELAQIYQIQSIPTIIIFKDGKPVDGFAGFKNSTAILEILEKHKDA